MGLRGDCLNECLFFFLKHSYPKTDLHKYLVNDLNFRIDIAANGAVREICCSSGFALKEGLIQFENYEFINGKSNATDKLEQLLNENKYVIIQTALHKVPISMKYNPAATESYTNHIFLMVHFDDKKYYIVDNLNIYNDANMVGKYNDVYQIDKKYFDPAMHECLRCSIPSINEEKSQSYVTILNSTLIAMAREFFSAESMSGTDGAVFGGRAALNELISLIDQRKLELLKETSWYGLVRDYLHWKLYNLRSKRFALYKTIISIPGFRNRNRIMLFFEEDFKYWSILCLLLEKAIVKEEQYLAASSVLALTKIRDIEEQLFSTVLNDNCNIGSAENP
ncbi:hypothetical protein FACS18948_4950 [Clostridia bacterium]|nr:hypothetical protein FACS18948_4950 [Clostridia bacterium]